MASESKRAWVIRYDGLSPSYYAGPTAIGPRFGATQETAATFGSEAEAEATIAAMPMMAAMCCAPLEVGRG